MQNTKPAPPFLCARQAQPSKGPLLAVRGARCDEQKIPLCAPAHKKTADFTLRLITQDENNSKSKIKPKTDTETELLSQFTSYPLN